MTLDKAIERVKEGAPFSELYNKEWEDALSTVVRAASLINNIKKEIQADIVKEIIENYISRQVLKKQMLKYGFHAPDMTVTEFVENLSPTKQKSKTGHWIYGEDWTGRDGWYCNQCRHFEFWDYSLDMKSAELNLPNVCPKCGARMFELPESENKMSNITIEEVKDILKCSIDETTNMNEAIERSLQHIYLKGWNDAESLQNEKLRKIKKEMKELLEIERQIYGKNNWQFVNKCIDIINIIDRYAPESEVKE